LDYNIRLFVFKTDKIFKGGKLWRAAEKKMLKQQNLPTKATAKRNQSNLIFKI
jgi:hypothetical protein